MTRTHGRLLPRLFFMLVVFFAFSLIADRGLSFFGFTGELKIQVADPPNYQHRRSYLEFDYDLETNSLGLAYPDIPLKAGADEYRVFVAGDSYVQGLGVDMGQRFTSVLEDGFSDTSGRVRFIAGGLVGAGPLEYGRLFLEVGLKYQPDALLICVYANDVIDTSPGYDARMLYMTNIEPEGFHKVLYTLWPRSYAAFRARYLARQKKLHTRPADFMKQVIAQARVQGISEERIIDWQSSVPRELVDAVDQGRFNGSILSNGLLHPDYWVDALDLGSEQARDSFDALSGILDELVRCSRRNQMQVAVVYLPCAFEYDPAFHEPGNPFVLSGHVIRGEWLEGQTIFASRLGMWAGSRELKFLDLTERMREQVKSNKLNHPLDGHWNAAGHKAAGQAINEWIIRREVFEVR